MAKRYYWLKLKDDFFNKREVKKLRKIAGGDTFTIIYLKLLLLSIKNEGKIFYEGVESSFAEEMALELDEDVENVSLTLTFLQSQNLIEEIEFDEFLLPEAMKSIGSETDSAERVRKHRVGQKLLQCNTTVTEGNTEKEKEKEKDKEIEIEKNIKKEKKKTEFDLLIESYTDDLQLRNTIYEFIKMRKAIRSPMTSNALKLMLGKLDKLSLNDDSPGIRIAMLEQSIMNSWKGVFEIKEDSGYKKSNGYNQQSSSMDNLKELYKEAGLKDEQEGNNTTNSPFGF